MTDKVDMPESAWRACLAPEQHHALREKGTEPAFTGRYHDTKTPGRYRCAGCGQDLFSPEMKFDSGRGWPSFMQLVQPSAAREEDRSYGIEGTECSAPGVTGRVPRRKALRQEWWLSRRDVASVRRRATRTLAHQAVGVRHHRAPPGEPRSVGHLMAGYGTNTGCGRVGVPRTTGEAVRQ